jgi:hypothetical protein
MSRRQSRLLLRRRSRMPLLGASLAAALAATGFASAGTAQAASLPTISIAATSSTATVTGPLESGGANIVSSSTGVKEGSLVLFLLKPGTTVAEAEAYLREKKGKGDPNNASVLGSIVFDTELASGQRGESQTDLAAGQYLVLVAVGEGEPKLASTFQVATAKAPASLPAPAATVRSIEFAFRGPSTLHDGELVRFENEGFLVHMDVAFPVKSTKAARQAVKYLLAGKEKAIEKLISGPPVTFAGPLSHGAYQQETINAKPGVYVQVCFMETQDGRDHTRLGMERIIKIAK